MGGGFFKSKKKATEEAMGIGTVEGEAAANQAAANVDRSTAGSTKGFSSDRDPSNPDVQKRMQERQKARGTVREQEKKAARTGSEQAKLSQAYKALGKGYKR